MHYVGYHGQQTLPIRSGDEIMIPAGVRVRSTHPQRRRWVSKRKMKRLVNHILPGQSLNISLNIGELHRQHYPAFAEWFQVFDDIRAHASSASFADEQGRRVHRFIHEASIPTQNPQVVWVGAGQYWCEADINDVLGNPIGGVPSAVTLLDSYLEIAS